MHRKELNTGSPDTGDGRLESRMNPTTFQVVLDVLGLRIEQVAYDLGVSEQSVKAWRKKSAPSSRAAEYIQKWLDRTDADITAIVNDAEARYEDGQPYIILETAYSGAGLKQLDPRYHDYPARVHGAMISRAFAELNARGIPARVELIERQHLNTLQREPEPQFEISE